jgi:hypothetical protein
VSTAVTGLVLLVAIGVSVGLFAWGTDPETGSLRFELAKTSMQMVGITLVGAVAAIAVFALQQTIADGIKQQVEDREDRRERERQTRDLQLEQRARQDDLVRSMLGDTLDAYHGVKTVRRELRALVGRKGSTALTIKDYHRWMRAISEHQLEFEELMRRAPLTNDALDGLALPASVPGENDKYDDDDASVGGRYRAIETYLNDLIAERRKVTGTLIAAGDEAISGAEVLPRLTEFVTGDGLPSSVSTHVRTICKVYRESLLRPTVIEYPTAADGT